ncbi:MAG: hypothetical protein OEY97_12540 [Nitrospirota bacterium]|nr:hypothetical protein [Nitrospirota bacterium]
MRGGAGWVWGMWLGALLPALTAHAGEPMRVLWWTGDVSVMVGEKTVPTLGAAHETQDLLGVRVTFGKNVWPVAVALDVEFSESATDAAGNRMELTEGRVGVRKSHGGGVLHPFWGGGLSVARLKVIEPPLTGGYGPGLGYWLGAGATLDISRGSHLGASWVHSRLNLDTRTVTVDRSDGVRLFWGWRW